MDIAKLRLINQHVDGTSLKTAGQVVGWLGAVQAQEYGMARWAVGLRLPGSTEQQIEDALSSGEILKTHVLRPTLHLVAAADLRWMLELSAAHIKAAIRSYQAGLGLTEALFAKSNALLAQTLRQGNHLTRKQVTTLYQQHGIATDENRAAQLLMMAELDGVICSGEIRDQQQTYALLDERVPAAGAWPGRDAALAMLARRYFTSHGPASLQDFCWWAGVNAGAGRQALEEIRPELDCETIGEQTYWFANSAVVSPAGRSLHLLPGFDELIISYAERSAALSAEARSRVITSNGIFRPTLLRDGRVIGLWSRNAKKDRLLLEGALFNTPDEQTRAEIEQACARYAAYAGKPVQWSWRPQPDQ